MRRTKANRALTFVMAAALLIGSIHGVGAKEQSKDYDAPELTLVQDHHGLHFYFQWLFLSRRWILLPS